MFRNFPGQFQGNNLMMTTSLWILNTALSCLYAFALLLMFFLRIDVPQRLPLVSKTAAVQSESDSSALNPALIYDNDLFNTMSQPTLPEPEKERPRPEIQIPAPPVPQEIPSKKAPTPEFLPPLAIKLKGVIFDANPLFSRAIIASTKTKEEKSYKIGDTIEDTTLIHLDKRKAVFIRSNGQQEVLFVTEEDAQNDAIYQGDMLWPHIITRLNEKTFSIDTKGFKKRIKNVAQILDMLDITTAFEKGKSLGCHVGQLIPHSLGEALGLKQGDIITKINDKETKTSSQRVAIYNEITNAGTNQTIAVSVQRGTEELIFTYNARQSTDDQDDDLLEEELQKESPKIVSQPRRGAMPAGIFLPEKTERLSEERANQLKKVVQQPVNAPVSEALKKRDQKSMLNYGGRNAFIKR